MRINRRDVMAGAAASVLAMATGPALALDEAQAKSHVTTTIEELMTLLRQSGTAESRAPALRSIMETRGNMPLIAKFSAGRAWRDMNENQQTRFINAFARFVSLTYARRFDEFSGDPNITVGRTLDAGKKGILVETPFAQAQQQPIAVEWLISDRGGRVEIIDLVVEGISLATTQREEIGAMLDKRNGDVEALISDLAASS